MWSQNALNAQEVRKTEGDKILTEKRPKDSGFISYEESTKMRSTSCGISTDIEIAESLRNRLTLKNTELNNLNDVRTRIQPITISNPENRCDVRRSEQNGCDVLNQPCDLFFRQDSDGDTQLHMSIVMKYTEAALWLINQVPQSCLLDLANDESHTALHLAVLSHEPRIVRRLVLAGANSEIRTLAGNTALHLACALGDLECVRAITEVITTTERTWLANKQTKAPCLPSNLQLRNYNGKTCLHIAASNGQIEIVDQLIRSGAEVDTPEGFAGQTALHLAIENGHRELVHYLARRCRSCLDAVTYAGFTAYQLAVERDPQLAEELVQQFGIARIVSIDDSDGSGSECTSDSGSDSGSTSSSDEQPDMFSPRMSSFMNWDWTKTRST